MKITLTKLDGSQAGFSAIAMIIILMLLGLTLLLGVNQLITSWQKSIIIELNYYPHFNHASSSLSWGSRLNWTAPSDHWQCQHEATYQLTACIKTSSLSTDNYTLLRGSADDFHLYQLTSYQNGKLKIESGHWLDYCPEKRVHSANRDECE